MSKLYYIAVGAIITMITMVAINYYTKYTNTEINDITIPIKQTTEIVKVNDSISAIQQKLLITKDKEIINSLQDSLQAVINRLANVKPNTILKYQDKYQSTNQVGKLRDSLSSVIDDLLARSKDASLTEVEFAKYKNDILNRKISYKIQSKYRYEVGKIDYIGNITSDTLIVTSEPLISIGEKYRFLRRPTYLVTVGNRNPLITSSNLSSVMYKPKISTEFSFGPMIMTNGKDYTAGMGINIKRNIFSLSIGYQLANTKK